MAGKIVCRCKGCGKLAKDILEYKTLAMEMGYEDADEAVANEEGTFNPKTGAFYCTTCYIKAGMPLGIA